MANLMGSLDNYYEHNAGQTLKKTITFAGGTPNAIGDFNGTGDPFTIATVTGTVAVKIFGVCTTALVAVGGTATLEVGVAGQTAGLIAQIADAEDLDVNEIWFDATPTTIVEAFSSVSEYIVGNGADIIGTVGTENITAGVIDFVIIWRPLTPSASLTV